MTFSKISKTQNGIQNTKKKIISKKENPVTRLQMKNQKNDNRSILKTLRMIF
jgi:hypothetical protein